ncbi:calcium-binding protein [Hansschlegelia plantiphila]|uniref:Calcium-binding protein n=1 Tax=Hansschlegelia plantiphila TaxID=374655 RepID=A0A9W6IZ90_9HYPH|nr:calcium-binding protein [Hansschlegelia plantiphila]GLK67891.1 hypothetical protein GCM10008179_15290 [Hansschlegelia plantiphila]
MSFDDAYAAFNASPAALFELFGSSTFVGTQGRDTIAMGSAADTLLMSDGSDTGSGGGGDDSIDGGSGYDLLHGDAGADTIDGGLDVDVMYGGAGGDTFFVDDASDQVIENNESGVDLVNASVTFSLAGQYVENITLTGDQAIDAVGNSLNNVLTGNSAANTLTGGKGNDTYYVQNVDDKVVELDGQGADQVYSTVTFSLAGQYIEKLTLTGFDDIDATGNSLNNAIVGNAGDNVLDGGAGADTMSGGGGDDDYYVQNAGDVAKELDGQGNDRVLSSVSYALTGQYVERLRLTGDGDVHATGNTLNNTIAGNAGDNVIDGWSGADTMAGGSGADTFVFDTKLGASNVDHITDFKAADDTIRLENGVFTGLSTGALAADAFHIGTTAADAQDRVIYNATTGALFFDRDGTGATYTAVQFATLENHATITAADFTVV